MLMQLALKLFISQHSLGAVTEQSSSAGLNSSSGGDLF